jgi:hypothetical protein
MAARVGAEAFLCQQTAILPTGAIVDRHWAASRSQPWSRSERMID